MFFLVRNWPHSVGQNHFFLKMIFNRDSAIQKCFQKILHSLQGRKLGSLSAVRTTCHTVRTTRTFRPNLPLCQEVSNCSSLHQSRCFGNTSGRLSVFDQASGFLSKTWIWEDCCNRLDALIHKASISIQIQTFRRQSAWFGLAYIRYGNCVHQINCPDDHSSGLDERSLYKEITCNGRATVCMTGPHRPEAAQKQERISAKFLDN